MRSEKQASRHPGFWVAVWIFALYLVFLVVFLVFFPKVEVAGLPLVTWSMILVAVGALCVATVRIFSMTEWEERSRAQSAEPRVKPS